MNIFTIRFLSGNQCSFPKANFHLNVNENRKQLTNTTKYIIANKLNTSQKEYSIH